MKKVLPASGLTMLLLIGCQNAEQDTLDTSNVKKIEMEGVSAEEQNGFPIAYKAPSVKTALEALPFDMKLPKDLPFKAEPYQAPVINDMAHDGKKLWVEFNTISKSKEERAFLTINVFSNEKELDEIHTANTDEVNLSHGVIGYYSGDSISFNQHDVSYSIAYRNEQIPDEQYKSDLIKIARQMIN